MADESTLLYLDPELVSYGCAYCNGQLVGEVAVDSTDGTAHIDESTLEDWFSADLLFAYDADGSGRIVLRIYAQSMFVSWEDFRDARVRVYADGGGEAFLTVQQRGMGASPYTAVVTPETLEAPTGGGRTGWVLVEVYDGVIVRMGSAPIVDADTLPDWVEGVEYDPDNGTSSYSRFRLTVSANGTGERREGRVYFGVFGTLIAGVDVVQDAPPVPEWKPAHSGEFLDIRGNTWRAEVLRLTTDEVTETGLDFPADRPLTLEWPSSAFEDALWGSSAALRVVSPGDRTYIGLYTVEPGTIRLDVYRDGSLFWSGMLDPEFYEEPYERLNGYEVELTFTDFGILDRLKYDLEGVQAVTDIIARAVEASGVTADAPDLSLVQIGAGGLHVDSDNFTDEEGEVMSWREALEGVLTPLGVRMVQRGGRIVLFDLAGLRAAGAVSAAVWAGDSQTLGVDRVYSSVTVTFSPYVRAALLEDALEFGSEVSTSDINTGDYDEGDTSDPKRWTFFPDTTGAGVSGNQDYDFTLFVGSFGSGVTFGNDAPLRQYFHILPIYGGADECTGVPYLFTPLGDPLRKRGRTPSHSGTRQDRWLTLPRVRVPAADGKHLIRISVELLLDCRYNPFSGATENNYSDAQDNYLAKASAFVFLPAWATLYDSEEGGTAICHWDNSASAYAGNNGWVEPSVEDGRASFGDLWLEWYDPDDLTDDGGAVGGWKGNRKCIGMPDGGGSSQSRPTYAKPLAKWANAPDGEYLPLPPQGGWLEVAIGDDFAGFAYGSGYALGDTSHNDSWGDVSGNRTARGNLRWCLIRNPEVSVVKGDIRLSDPDGEDVEYRGTLDEAAQDDLSIDTVCGTADGVSPTARGLFLNADGSPVSELTRDGVTARPEELLIGQLYGQYAARKAVITGEAETPGTLLLTEDNQEGRTFILAGDTQDVRMATSDIEIRELGDDTYSPES